MRLMRGDSKVGVGWQYEGWCGVAVQAERGGWKLEQPIWYSHHVPGGLHCRHRLAVPWRASWASA